MQYATRSYETSGQVWQGRYYSCPLDDAHFWEALRYVELNPVRAGLVERAEDYPWSSAAAHCGAMPAEGWLEMDRWSRCWSASSRRDFLAEGVAEENLEAIRECTHTGRPLGTQEFVEELVSCGCVCRLRRH